MIKVISHFLVIHFKGTVNTGAFDDLLELSLIARAENVWFHIDGAFGSLVILDPKRRHLVTGIERADSLAFDFHKWLHCPHDAGCVLIRDGALLQSTFSTHQAILARSKRGFPGDELWFCDLGPELSRAFRALKVWFTLKEHGTVKLGQKIADNCEQIQYLVSLLEKHEQIIRIVRPVSLNIVNFRFEPEQLQKANHELVDKFNDELVMDIQTSGIALLSTTRIQKLLYIRVCIVSHRTILKDFDVFMGTLLNLYQTRIKSFVIDEKSN
jgi:aromatic-L-amino-acid decarboxylase